MTSLGRSPIKGGALVIWWADLRRHIHLCLRPRLSDKKIVRETLQDLISKQEFPATAQNLITTAPRTSPVSLFQTEGLQTNNS